jgi:hypothetical protein
MNVTTMLAERHRRILQLAAAVRYASGNLFIVALVEELIATTALEEHCLYPEAERRLGLDLERVSPKPRGRAFSLGCRGDAAHRRFAVRDKGERASRRDLATRRKGASRALSRGRSDADARRTGCPLRASAIVRSVDVLRRLRACIRATARARERGSPEASREVRRHRWRSRDEARRARVVTQMTSIGCREIM